MNCGHRAAALMLIIFALVGILIFSAGTMLYLFVRALPRTNDAEAVKRGVLERWLTTEFPERMDIFFHTVFLRTLRRLKVLVLKFDNTLNRKIETIKLEKGGGIRNDERSGLQSMAEERTGDTD